MSMKHTVFLVIFFFSFSLLAEDENVSKVKYKESGRIDFESLLIEGERNKPELSVITGSLGEKDNGLMIMRKEFSDMMASDFGEVIK